MAISRAADTRSEDCQVAVDLSAAAEMSAHVRGKLIKFADHESETTDVQ